MQTDAIFYRIWIFRLSMFVLWRKEKKAVKLVGFIEFLYTYDKQNANAYYKPEKIE